MNVLIRENFRTYLVKQHVTVSAPEAQVSNENESVIQKRNQRNKSVIPRICLTIYLTVKNQSKILYFWLRHDCIGHSYS